MIAQRVDTFGTVSGPVKSAIERYADQMETERKMPLELHRILKEAGLFSIYAPRQFGGLDYPLPEAVRVVESVSTVDGSTGWTVALNAVSGYLTASVSDEAAAKILGDGSSLVVGGGRPQRAVIAEGGYRLYGELPFCSGLAHADWVSGLAAVFEGDVPRVTPHGPEMVMFFAPRSEVEMRETWDVTGLLGTGTHDAVFSGAFIPRPFTAAVQMPPAITPLRDAPLARLPFFTAGSLVQSPPVCLGIARHAIQAFREIAKGKVNPMTGASLAERHTVQAGLARAEALVRAARALYYETVATTWAKALEAEPLTNDDRAAVRLTTTLVAEHTSAAVDMLFRMAGTGAVSARTPLERCWRDIHTAASHAQAQDSHWESSGRVLLGMEPGVPGF